MIALLKSRIPTGDDRGVSLVTVLALGLLMALLATAAVASATGGMRFSRHTQDWNAALAAAYAGAEECQSRLHEDPSCYQAGNPNSSCSLETSCKVVLPETLGLSPNAAFSLTDWGTVSGSDGRAKFRYEVDNSRYFIDGTLRLRSTGYSGEETRSIVVELRQKGFIDFLYFTDYEVGDPMFSGSQACVQYLYNYPSLSRPSNCSGINFITADTIDGPLHTNDVMQILGNPTFLGDTTSSLPPDKRINNRRYATSGTANPTFAINPNNEPGYLGTLGMPQTNAELKKEVTPDNHDVPNPGCLYTGPTKLTFKSNGRLHVKSPFTKYTSPLTHDNEGCGTPGPNGIDEEIDAPVNNVIYVQNVPSAANDPNYTANNTTRSQCSNDNSRNSLGYPISNETAPNYSDSPSYGCRNGDVFVSGQVNAQATIAAENFVYITGSLTYVDKQRDILGLVGQNAVFVWNPVQRNGGWTTSYTNLLTDNGRQIDAAILSVAHTFTVQNYDKGNNRGTLAVTGAIAQKFRGPVGTGSGGNISTGYGKKYIYDERFRYTAPPKFLSPVTTTYGINTWVEVTPVFDTNGTEL